MTTVMRVRTETRAKRRRAPSVVPLVVGVVIVRPVVVIPLVVVILSDRCRLRRHDPGLVTAAALRVLPGAAARSVGASRRITGLWSAGAGAPGDASDPATYAVTGTTTARRRSTLVTCPMGAMVQSRRGGSVRRG